MTRALKIGLGIVTTLAVIYIGLTFYLNHRIKDVIENDLLASQVTTSDVSNNLWSGSVTIEGLKTGDSNDFNSKVGHFEINGLSYYDLLFNGNITIDKVQVSDFEIHLPLEPQSSGESKNRQITLKQVTLNNGAIFNRKSDTLSSRIHGISADVDNLKFSTDNFKKSLKYQINNIKADSSFLKLNDYEDLKTNDLIIGTKDVEIKQLMIKTNFDKRKQIKADKVNKDELSLETRHVYIKDYKIAIEPNLLFSANKISIDSAQFKITANNNLEKTEVVRSYSEQLRSMGLKLDIKSIDVKNSKVSYSEPNTENTKRGAITFEDINVDFLNFNNIEGKGAITAKTSAVFMGARKFETDFSMNPYDANDAYEWSGSISNFDLKDINPFLRPVLNMELQGEVKQYYFSIYGNKNTYKADIKINFEDAKIKLLNQKFGLNSILSGLANLLATNGSDGKLMDQTATLPRDSKATFFNQVWQVQRKALIEVVK
jgi:hypothetical protein